MNLFKIFKKDLILEMTMGCSCLLFGRAFVADLPIFSLEFLFFIFLCLSAVCYLITSAHKSLPLQVVVSNNILKATRCILYFSNCISLLQCRSKLAPIDSKMAVSIVACQHCYE